MTPEETAAVQYAIALMHGRLDTETPPNQELIRGYISTLNAATGRGPATFTITRQWARDHVARRTGWTRAQLAAIGLTWPIPRGGWITRLVGTRITDEQRRVFEAGAAGTDPIVVEFGRDDAEPGNAR